MSADELIQEYLPVVDRVVGRVVAAGLRPWIEASDLASAGQFALVLAAREYDAERGEFGPFAYVRVRRAVIDELRKLSVRQFNRVEMPEDVNIQPDRDRRIDIHAAMLELPEQQFQVISMYFRSGKSQAEIAEAVGLDQSSVSRMVNSAKKTLRLRINGKSQTHISIEGEIRPKQSGLGQIS